MEVMINDTVTVGGMQLEEGTLNYMITRLVPFLRGLYPQEGGVCLLARPSLESSESDSALPLVADHSGEPGEGRCLWPKGGVWKGWGLRLGIQIEGINSGRNTAQRGIRMSKCEDFDCRRPRHFPPSCFRPDPLQLPSSRQRPQHPLPWAVHVEQGCMVGVGSYLRSSA